MSRKQRNNSGLSSFVSNRFIGQIIAIVCIAILAALGNWIHSHNKVLTMGDTIELDPYIESGEELPVGKFVSLTDFFPLGRYASHETSVFGVQSSEDTYFGVYLDDGSILSVKVARTEDIEALNQLSQQLFDAIENDDLYSYEYGSYQITGKLVELEDNSELRRMYRDLADMLEIEQVRYLVIDTTAVRSLNVVFVVVLPVALVIAILIILVNAKKKVKQQNLESDDNQHKGISSNQTEMWPEEEAPTVDAETEYEWKQ